MVQVSGLGGLVSIDSGLNSGVMAIGSVPLAVTCPVNCVGPLGGLGMSKGLLGWVVVG